MATGKRWTRDELLVTLNLYHKLSFGQFHSRQASVIALADRMGRGANSVAMKLCNFASLDPALTLRGIKGLAGASVLDRDIWAEYHTHLDQLAPASEEAMRQLFQLDETDELQVLPKDGFRVLKTTPVGATEIRGVVTQRRGQQYFREVVLNNFAGRCGISQIPIRDLLIASHILPWGKHTESRLDVTNGLCLSRLHDAAFDRYLISFDDDWRLLLSSQLKSALPQQALFDNFAAHEHCALILPTEAIVPSLDFMAQHRAIFLQRH
jgi:putative restriction endonuclease